MSMPIRADSATIEQFFDRTATKYDRSGPGVFVYFGARLVEWMSLTPGSRVLDVATGTGAVLLPAAQRVGPKGCVVGVDLSSTILQEAEHLAGQKGLTNVEFRRMDAEHLEFPDQAFDFVTCAFSIHFFQDIEAGMREMYRVCKVGGWVGVSVFHKTLPSWGPLFPLIGQIGQKIGAMQEKVWVTPHDGGYLPEEAESVLKKLGLRSVQTHSETSNFVYSNEEDIWGLMVSLFTGQTLLNMKEETRVRFKTEYLASLRPMFSTDGLHLSVAAVYAMGQR